ncbi:hypothetical protein [Actinospica robiniae]|uniref:hypothetical protein n=1 Tax=Actinospica robiniae TaxID=304901 RepID=UPI000429BDC6|nr:hypothetical protein [Actinospica robiniae]
MTSYDPADFPPTTSHRAIAAVMTGPTTFTAALELQEWIRDLIAAGFTDRRRTPRPVTGSQHAFEVTDPAGLLLARAEYGSHWPTRTMIGPFWEAEWWASCPGLIPAAAILAARHSLKDPGLDVQARLDAAGWHRTPAQHGTGEPELVTTWSLPDASRGVIRMNAGPDQGWLIHRDVMRSCPPISAALTTPPGVIAALALTF